MKKIKLVTLVILMLVACLTTTLSLVFWSSGQINTPTKTVDLATLEIGEGGSATLTLNLTPSGGSANTLVPKNIPALPGETTSVQYTVAVTWTTPVGDEATVVSGKTGTLVPSVNSIKVAGSETEYKNVTGLNAPNLLFQVSFAHAPSSTITANSGTVTTTVTVQMDEPLDSDQYNAIAGKQISIQLLFSVTPGW